MRSVLVWAIASRPEFVAGMQSPVDEGGDCAIELDAMSPPALHALLAHSIDYAGLFPPADLALGTSADAITRRMCAHPIAGCWELSFCRWENSARPACTWLSSTRSIRCKFPRSERRPASPQIFGSSWRKRRRRSRNCRLSTKVAVAITQFEMPLPAGSVDGVVGDGPRIARRSCFEGFLGGAGGRRGQDDRGSLWKRRGL